MVFRLISVGQINNPCGHVAGGRNQTPTGEEGGARCSRTKAGTNGNRGEEARDEDRTQRRGQWGQQHVNHFHHSEPQKK